MVGESTYKVLNEIIMKCPLWIKNNIVVNVSIIIEPEPIEPISMCYLFWSCIDLAIIVLIQNSKIESPFVNL